VKTIAYQSLFIPSFVSPNFFLTFKRKGLGWVNWYSFQQLDSSERKGNCPFIQMSSPRVCSKLIMHPAKSASTLVYALKWNVIVCKESSQILEDMGY